MFLIYHICITMFDLCITCHKQVITGHRACLVFGEETSALMIEAFNYNFSGQTG